MRRFLPAAAVLMLVSVPANALVYWHGPGYYIVGCDADVCSILGGPFDKVADCHENIAKGGAPGPEGKPLNFECRHFKDSPDERQFYNPWKGG
jgi:hypothetical protein